MKRLYEIDGANFSTIEGFYEAISETLIPGAIWGRSLDAFNDILRGGFGTPDDGFILRWKNASLSRFRLGYPETARCLESRLQRSPPENNDGLWAQLEDARSERGPTLFETLLEITRTHGPGGYEAEDGVELILE